MAGRGSRRWGGWAVAHLALALTAAPRCLAQDTATAGGDSAAGRRARPADTSTYVATAQRFYQALARRGIYPGAAGQGANSGVGPIVRLVLGRDTGSAAFALLQGGVTYRKYWHTEIRAGMYRVAVYVRREERPRDIFFGIGNGSREIDLSDYGLTRSSVGAQTTIPVAPRFTAGLAAEWARVATSAGDDADRPNIDSTFSPSEHPGFGATHRAVSLSMSFDWAAGARHGAARTGSWAAARYRWFTSRTAGIATYGVLRIAATVELPFNRRRGSVVLGGAGETLRPATAGVIPFYALPTLGGARSLPSFRSERFRDRDALVGVVEARYRVWRHPTRGLWLDAVAFTTAGMVATRLREALGSARLHQSTGVAVAVITSRGLLARLGASHGSEGIGWTLATATGF